MRKTRRLGRLIAILISIAGVALNTPAASAGPPFKQIFVSMKNTLPVWPIQNVGDPISDKDIAKWKGAYCSGIPGHFSAFPSKTNKDLDVHPGDETQKNAAGRIATRDPGDPDANCDDGDQTAWNGLLCAAGNDEGCRAVAAAQANDGRWFRSPHRKWMWTFRCSKKTSNPSLSASSKNEITLLEYDNDCAYSFSPDMNLGILLYTLTTNDLKSYKKWLNWLDENSHTNQLCKISADGQSTYDCIKFANWPRVCTDDIGNLAPNHKPGYPIDGRYGGQCALRPWDELDFSVVNVAKGVAWPPALAKWDALSRAAILSVKALSTGIVGGIPAVGAPAAAPVFLTENLDPIILMAAVDDPGYPVHLDAVRILIRMLARNPTLHLNNLPDVPDPSDLVPGALDLAAPDGTSPAAIRSAASLIHQRVGWDPFYALLDGGPTSEVRSQILSYCASLDGSSLSDEPYKAIYDTSSYVPGDWIWEKDVAPPASKVQSMGWDCVFLGSLYNKMRVRKVFADELISTLSKYADRLDLAIKHASELVRIAELANDTAEHAFDEATKILNEDKDFSERTYAARRTQLIQTLNDATASLAHFETQKAQVEKSIASMSANLATLPPTVPNKVANKLCKTDFTGLTCRVTSKIEQITNPAIDTLNGRISAANDSLTKLNTDLIVHANRTISDTNTALGDLDRKLQDVASKLSSGALQDAVDVAKADFDLKSKAFKKIADALAALKQADARTREYLCVWRAGSKCEA